MHYSLFVYFSTHLAAEDGEDALRMDEAWVAEVVQAARLEDLGAGLEPYGLAKLDAVVLGQDLGRHAAERAKHGPASVDELELAVPLERLWVSRQAGGVLQAAFAVTSNANGQRRRAARVSACLDARDAH